MVSDWKKEGRKKLRKEDVKKLCDINAAPENIPDAEKKKMVSDCREKVNQASPEELEVIFDKLTTPKPSPPPPISKTPFEQKIDDTCITSADQSSEKNEEKYQKLAACEIVWDSMPSDRQKAIQIKYDRINKEDPSRAARYLAEMLQLTPQEEVLSPEYEEGLRKILNCDIEAKKIQVLKARKEFEKWCYAGIKIEPPSSKHTSLAPTTSPAPPIPSPKIEACHSTSEMRFEMAKKTTVEKGEEAEEGEEAEQIERVGPYITRKFTIIPLDQGAIPPAELFPLFQIAVNRMITIGLNDAALQVGFDAALTSAPKAAQFLRKNFPTSLFRKPKKDSQGDVGKKAVMNFFTIIGHTSQWQDFVARCNAGTIRLLKRRPLYLVQDLWRAAAQYSYFAVREFRNLLNALPEVVRTLQDQDDVTQVLDGGFPSDSLYNTVRTALWGAKLGLTEGQLSKVALGGWCRYVRNQVKQALISTYINEVKIFLKKVTITSGLVDDLQKWLAEALEKQLKSFLKALSSRMTHRVKMLLKEPSLRNDTLDSMIEKVVLTGRSLKGLNIKTWEALRKQWREKTFESLRQDLNQVNIEEIAAEALKEALSGLTPFHLLRVFIAPRPHRVTLTDSNINEFSRFLVAQTIPIAEQRIAASLKPAFQPLIQTILGSLLTQLQQRRVNYPRFEKQSIPLGQFDKEVYEVPVMTASGPVGVFKLQKLGSGRGLSGGSIPFRFTLHTPERFRWFADRHYVQGQGTLNRKGNHLILAIPFQRTERTPAAEVAVQSKEPPLVAGLDLGLKSLATLSIAPAVDQADGTWKRADEEKARYFIDQRYLEGKKDHWLSRHADGTLKLRPEETGDHKLRNLKARQRRHKGIPMGFNWKRELTNLQAIARQRQAALKNYQNESRAKGIKEKDYRKTRVHWRLRREWKQVWRKIRAIHEQIACQLATRIVAACVSEGVSVIRVEDLSWSSHSAKWKVGYFLTTWQVHWFFGRTQQHLQDLAAKEGILVEKVDPRGTSQRCSRCGAKPEPSPDKKKKFRHGKLFVCGNPQCGLHLDADLNGARNILVAPLLPAL